MTAKEWYDKYGSNIRNLTERKAINSMRKHSVKDTWVELIHWVSGWVSTSKLIEFEIPE